MPLPSNKTPNPPVGEHLAVVLTEVLPRQSPPPPESATPAVPLPTVPVSETPPQPYINPPTPERESPGVAPEPSEENHQSVPQPSQHSHKNLRTPVRETPAIISTVHLSLTSLTNHQPREESQSVKNNHSVPLLSLSTPKSPRMSVETKKVTKRTRKITDFYEKICHTDAERNDALMQILDRGENQTKNLLLKKCRIKNEKTAEEKLGENTPKKTPIRKKKFLKSTSIPDSVAKKNGGGSRINSNKVSALRKYFEKNLEKGGNENVRETVFEKVSTNSSSKLILTSTPSQVVAFNLSQSMERTSSQKDQQHTTAQIPSTNSRGGLARTAENCNQPNYILDPGKK